MPKLRASQRKRVIINAAAKVAEDIGLVNITFTNVADACAVETSDSTVRHYFPHLQDLQKSVYKGNLKLQLQAIEMGLIEK